MPQSQPHEAAAMRSPIASDRRIRDVMRRDFITISTGESVLEAVHLMRLARLRHLAVERNGVLVGILSYRDLQDEMLSRAGEDAAPRRPSPLAKVAVAERMAASPYTIGPEATLAEAAARLERLRVGCLPVVESDEKGPRLVGLITEMDLVRAAYGV
jgi:acetoin utilization protein AcuB